jgi:hypothetical protein
MKAFKTCFFAIVSVGFLTCGTLAASQITLAGLPSGDTDTISIQLDPVDGAVHGLAGASVGWGFKVDWASTGANWISFTGSTLGSVTQPETNPALEAAYTDYIGSQGGPVDFSLGPNPGTWTELFDGTSNGVGLYQITNNPGTAVPGAQDTGQITFNFQVYNGDPLKGAAQIGNSSYSYYGSSTEFSVTVDAAPEPATFGLFLAATIAATTILLWRIRFPDQSTGRCRAVQGPPDSL